MASVIGLAPIRVCLKGRLLELLCIHGPEEVESVKCKVQNGFHFALCTPGSAFELAPEVGIAPTSPPLQGGANLPQLFGGASAQSPWSSRVVTLRGLPVISRMLFF